MALHHVKLASGEGTSTNRAQLPKAMTHKMPKGGGGAGASGWSRSVLEAFWRIQNGTRFALGKLSPNFLAPRTWFHGQFFQGPGWGEMVSKLHLLCTLFLLLLLLLHQPHLRSPGIRSQRLRTLALFSALPDRSAVEVKTEETEKGDFSKILWKYTFYLQKTFGLGEIRHPPLRYSFTVAFSGWVPSLNKEEAYS